MASPFDSIEEAIKDIKRGQFVVLLDDEDRENEGDLVMAAEKVTPQTINFMAKNEWKSCNCRRKRRKIPPRLGLRSRSRLTRDATFRLASPRPTERRLSGLPSIRNPSRPI